MENQTEPLYNYVLHCRFNDSERVRVVGACGSTPLEAFKSIVHLWAAANDSATLLGVASEERIN